MDPLLSRLSSGGTFPFEDSLSPEVFTSIFRQLWGAVVGGCEANEVVEEKDVDSLGVEDDNLVGRTERVQGLVGGEEPNSMEDKSWTLLAI
jgi:hypothetical protein